jgi:hypothetical protein
MDDVATSFDVISSDTRTQASRMGSFPAFGFDIEQDLLRACEARQAGFSGTSRGGR